MKRMAQFLLKPHSFVNLSTSINNVWRIICQFFKVSVKLVFYTDYLMSSQSDKNFPNIYSKMYVKSGITQFLLKFDHTIVHLIQTFNKNPLI